MKKCYNREKKRIFNSIKEVKEVIKKNKNVENNKILNEILNDLLIDYQILFENRENFKNIVVIHKIIIKHQRLL